MLAANREIFALLLRAQTGAAAEVEAEATAALGTGGLRFPAAAALHYVRGIAALMQGRGETTMSAARELVGCARASDAPEWVTVGELLELLPTAAAPDRADGRSAEGALPRLIDAEIAIAEPVRDGLARYFCLLLLGRCYNGLRLFELAEPCYEQAQQALDRSGVDYWAPVVGCRLTLSELHLAWAGDLRRIGRGDEAARHDAAAAGHARAALDLPDRPETRIYRLKAQLFGALADFERGDPEAAAATIRQRLTALGPFGASYDRAWALMYEARAVARAGRGTDAVALAREACVMLPDNAVPAISAAVLHTRAELVATLAGDGEVLAYGDHLARVLAAQRERNLEFARSLLVLARIRVERDRMQRYAYTDALTGLANRHAFVQYARELARDPYGEVLVAVVDVDDLKLVNDRLGHRAGDELLRMVALILVARCGAGGLAARLGGDEFVVVVRNPEPGLDGRLGGAIGDAVHEALSGRGSVSVGCVLGPAADLGGDLLRRADLAMYRHKRNPVWLRNVAAVG